MRDIGPVEVSPEIRAEHCDDGSILIRNLLALPAIEGSIVGRVSYWAQHTPDAPYLSEWERIITYAQADRVRRRWSARLASLQLSVDRPLMIVGENGIDHALAMLAATAVGIPVAVVTAAYGTYKARPWTRLAHMLDKVKPGLILADDLVAMSAALSTLGHAIDVRPLRDAAWMESLPAWDILAAEAATSPDSVAKLLFTSGSTGMPKPVINTQRMMVSNMLALSRVWPFLGTRPPVLVDWLPWSHTFCGNCCFNIATWFGGHLHIDKGRPAAGLFDLSIAAIRRHRPTLYFNVPLGYAFMMPVLENDPQFAAKFLGNVDFLFNAGAALPASLRTRLEAVGRAVTGRVPTIAGGWGSTETAPFATTLSFATPHAANLGVPIPGTTIKLVPDKDRYELRVKGPNITPGYWGDAITTVAAFDDEGFYRTGDAGRLAEPGDPAQGILFDGRVAENFKLASGTFVNAGALRLAIVSAGGGLIADAVIAGEGRDEICALLFLNDAACSEWLGEHAAEDDMSIEKPLAERLAVVNLGARGSSTKIARFAITAEPPSAMYNEITDKGYLNQRQVIERRQSEIERLYTDGHLI